MLFRSAKCCAPNAVISMFNAMTRIAINAGVVAVVTLSVSIIWALMSPTPWALVAGTTAGSVAGALMVWIWVPWTPSRPAMAPGTGELIGFGAGVTGFKLANFFSRNLDNILIGRVVTETGGATELASTRAGWAEMDPALKSQLKKAALWHRYSHSRARISPELAELPMFNKWPDQLWRAVWRNPVNGAEALYIASHAYAVEGLDADTGAHLIDAALAAVTQPQFVYSHQWRPGDVLIWDQRAVLHRGTPWNYKKPRKLSSICVSATPDDGVDAMRVIV